MGHVEELPPRGGGGGGGLHTHQTYQPYSMFVMLWTVANDDSTFHYQPISRRFTLSLRRSETTTQYHSPHYRVVSSQFDTFLFSHFEYSTLELHPPVHVPSVSREDFFPRKCKRLLDLKIFKYALHVKVKM